MNFVEVVLLIRITIGLYVSAAVFSLFFSAARFFSKGRLSDRGKGPDGYQKASNLIPNSLCMLASVAGLVSSVLFLTGSYKRTAIFNLKLSVPFISMTASFDSLSAFFTAGLSILAFCVSIYSMGYLNHYGSKRNIGLFNFLYSTFVLSMLMVITAGNTVFFFIAWEVMSLVSYFLVVFESESRENQRAGTLYIIMTHIGTAFLLVAFMLLYSYTGTFDLFAGTAFVPAGVKNAAFVLFLIGFGTKAGMIPLHIWLPYAHPAAPSNVSALMSGIMIKTAVYGLVRFVVEYLGIQSLWWGATVLILGVISAVFGVAYALMERDIKRLLAYSSIENIGIILIGLGTGMIAFSRGSGMLSALALTASLLHVFNHALFKGGLFLGAGAIQYSVHTKDMEQLGGLIKKMPLTSVFMLCFALAISAVVPFNGFVSEWLTYQSIFMSINPAYPAMNVVTILSAAALAISGAMALACFVRLFGISFLGLPRSSQAAEAGEVPFPMKAGMGILALFTVLSGLFPMTFLKILDKVAVEISGVSICGSLSGSSILLYAPLMASGSSIAPLPALIIIAAAAAAAVLAARLIGGKTAVRKYGTWDCGYESLNQRMQYSATGFSKPFRIVFRMLYRPSRELKVEEGASPYHPASIRYNVSTEKIIEKYLYAPLLKLVRKLSVRMKFSIQTGSVHMYLMYIFIVVLALMLYGSLAQ